MAVNLLPILLAGLAGSVHCAAMCGGIVGAFSAAPRSRPFPVAVVTRTAQPAAALDSGARVLAYNGGRIASYATAGALAGGVAASAGTLGGLEHVQAAAYWGANAMLVALGLYLAGVWNGIAVLERAGASLWRRVEPLGRRIMPLDSPVKMLALGALWGWLPCGMVYSMLVTAMLAGSALDGASVMAAFGLGTLPVMLSLGLAGERLRTFLRKPLFRAGAGVTVAAFGITGWWRAAGGLPAHWMSALCLAGVAG